MADDTYQEPARAATAALKARGSRFVAEAHRVATPEEALARLDAIRRAFHDASHHCWAYRTGVAGEEVRWNDDGEPSGSAGQPILRQIEGAELTNALVVVTRWFGGTKLGVGGLMRAYGGAAAAALAECGVAERIRRCRVDLAFDYTDTSPAMHTVDRFDCVIESTDYGANTRMRVAVRESQADAFREAFVEALAGRGSAEPAP